MIKEIIPVALFVGFALDFLSLPALLLGADLLVFGADPPLVIKRKKT